MKHQEGFFKGVRDISIYFQSWLPENEPKAILLIVHGLAEHSGRYMNIVNHFVPLGYAVYGIDHLGHGKSDGTRVHVERFEDYTNTLKVYLDIVSPGMAVTAEIKTGERRVIEFFISPFIKHVDESLTLR